MMYRHTITQRYLGQSPGNMLEVGCGTGDLSKGYSDYTGIDIDGKKIIKARKTYPDTKFIKGDILEHLYLVERADVIIALQVLEHIGTVKGDEDLKVIEAIRPGKKLIFSVPNRPSSNGSHVRYYNYHGWVRRYESILDLRREALFQLESGWENYLFEAFRV